MRQWSTCVGTPEKFSEHMEYSVCLIEQLLYCLLGFLGRGTTSGILLYLSLPTLAPFFFICPQWLHTHGKTWLSQTPGRSLLVTI